MRPPPLFPLFLFCAYLLVDVHELLRRLLDDPTLCSALLGDVRNSLSRDLRDLRRLSCVQRKLLARLRHLPRRLARRTYRTLQSFEHRAAARLQGADLIAAHVGGKLHRQIACRDLLHQRGQEPERRDRRSQQDVGDAQDERERDDADDEQRQFHLSVTAAFASETGSATRAVQPVSPIGTPA